MKTRGGAVLINSFDENKNNLRILNEYINEELTEETREITFKTRPDTTKLSIGFSNRYANTEATFKDVEFTKPKTHLLPNT